jgi:hypothetical protein
MRLGPVYGIVAVALLQRLSQPVDISGFQSDFRHEQIDHRRLTAVAQSAVDHLVGQAAARLSASPPTEPPLFKPSI